MPKKAGARSILAYFYAIAASSLILILLPMLVLSSEIVPTAVGYCRKDTPELADLLEYYGDGCKQEARKLELYQLALDMRIRLGEKDDKTAETINEIWNIKRYWPDYKATWMGEELAAKAAVLGPDSEDAIRTRTMWAIELSHQGKHKESSNLMRENLKYLKQAKGDHDYEIVSMLDHMSGIFKMNTESLEERADLLEEAVEISSRRKSMTPLGIEGIKSRLMLAELRCEMHDCAEVEKQFKSALTLSEGPNESMKRNSLQSYADFLSKTGQTSKAKAYFAQAEQLPTGRCGTTDHPTIWQLLGIETPF
ncbi:MAG: hypothetical protein Q8T09_08875 [Candidatus Melainabacteria bacterium]|nr:hypothetical protein [Candidatus Melainabacteria bacterium]